LGGVLNDVDTSSHHTTWLYDMALRQDVWNSRGVRNRCPVDSTLVADIVNFPYTFAASHCHF
jgi:hypothetical protein